MDAYLEEEFYDILTYCIENPKCIGSRIQKTKDIYDW